jgi:hypothetical protein
MDALTTGWLGILGATWIGITLIWLVLVAYRAVMGNHEDDQLFLGKGEGQMAAEQAVLVGKLNKLGKPIWAFGLLSGALLLTIIAAWIVSGLRANL